MQLMFLDIDQVLYTYVADDQGNLTFGPNQNSINLMKALLKEVPDLKIVLVSSWIHVLDLTEKDFINNADHPLAFLVHHLYSDNYVVESPKHVYPKREADESKTIVDTVMFMPFPMDGSRDTAISNWFSNMKIDPFTVKFIIVDDSVTCYHDVFYLQHLVPCSNSGFGFEEFQQACGLLKDDNKHVSAGELHHLTLHRLENKYRHVRTAFPSGD